MRCAAGHGGADASQTGASLRTGFTRFYEIFGLIVSAAATIAGAALFVIMWLIDANVFGRKILNSPVPSSIEVTEALMAVAIMLSLAYTQRTGEHLRVTLLTRRLGFAWQRSLYVFAALAGCLLFAAFSYALFEFALRSIRVGEYVWGAYFRFPIYPVKVLMCIGTIFLSIQFLLDAIRVGIVGEINLKDDLTDGTNLNG
ncbi:MAG: TRAP transporter small permease subunit [Flavobacteriaceae bacterium]